MTTTAYQITHSYGEGSHSEVLEQSLDLIAITKWYKTIVDAANCEQKLGTDIYDTDYISLEEIIVELDEDGEIDEVIDYGKELEVTTYK